MSLKSILDKLELVRCPVRWRSCWLYGLVRRL